MRRAVSRRLAEIADESTRARLEAALSVEAGWRPPIGWSLAADQRPEWKPEAWPNDAWPMVRARLVAARGPLTSQPCDEANAKLGDAVAAGRSVKLLLAEGGPEAVGESALVDERELLPQLVDAAAFGAWLTCAVEKHLGNMDGAHLLEWLRDIYPSDELLAFALGAYQDLAGRTASAVVNTSVRVVFVPGDASKSWKRRAREADARLRLFGPLLASRLGMAGDVFVSLREKRPGKHERTVALVSAFATDELGVSERNLAPILGRRKSAMHDLRERGREIVLAEGGYPWDRPEHISTKEADRYLQVPPVTV